MEFKQGRLVRWKGKGIEAEKAFGTVHFAIGDSYGIGKNKSEHHCDALVDKVTIRAKGRIIAQNGKFMI